MMPRESLSIRGLIYDQTSNPNPNNLHHYPPLQQDPIPSATQQPQPPAAKKKRNLPGTPDPDADVIALSPRTLMATNRFVCEICSKGFQRDQNLQLHRRGHNLPWKLKQRSNKDQLRKKVYVCPEKSCVHNDPSRALGDLTGIKKHFSRKHGEKKWKCDKCSKKYAVQSDWKAHSKTCGTREYKCDCGTIFSRKDSFITHRAFCDALTEESMRLSSSVGAADAGGMNPQMTLDPSVLTNMFIQNPSHGDQDQKTTDLPLWIDRQAHGSSSSSYFNPVSIPTSNSNAGVNLLAAGGGGSIGFAEMMNMKETLAPAIRYSSSGNGNIADSDSLTHMSATALLQKAAQMGASVSTPSSSIFAGLGGLMGSIKSTHQSNINNKSINSNQLESNMAMAMGLKGKNPNQNEPWNVNGSLTRDFLGLGGEESPCRPFSQQELAAKIASMGNNIDLMSSSITYNCRR